MSGTRTAAKRKPARLSTAAIDAATMAYDGGDDLLLFAPGERVFSRGRMRAAIAAALRTDGLTLARQQKRGR